MLPLSPASRSTFGTSAFGLGPRTHLLSPTQSPIRRCCRESHRFASAHWACDPRADGPIRTTTASAMERRSRWPRHGTLALLPRQAQLLPDVPLHAVVRAAEISRRQLPVQVGCVGAALGNTYVDPFAVRIPSGAPRPARPPVWTLFTPQVLPYRVARHAKLPSNPTSRMTLSMMLVDLLKPFDPSPSSRTLGLESW